MSVSVEKHLVEEAHAVNEARDEERRRTLLQVGYAITLGFRNLSGAKLADAILTIPRLRTDKVDSFGRPVQ